MVQRVKGDPRPPRDRVVQVRVPAEFIEKVDAVRGEWDRSEYIRKAVAKALPTLRGPST